MSGWICRRFGRFRTGVRRLGVPMAIGLVLAVGSRAWAEPHPVRLATSLQPAGTVSFRLHTERAWRNGAGEAREAVTLLKIPDLGEVTLQKTSSSVSFGWRWLEVRGAPAFRPQVSELPGPEDYFFQFTWDAAAGRFDFYVNGIPMRDPALSFEPWAFTKSPTEMVVQDGPFTIRDLVAEAKFLTPSAAREAVPAGLLNRCGEVFGRGRKPPAMAIEGRLGRVLVDVPLDEPRDVDDWVMEGPGKVKFEDGWMRMWSTRPGAAKGRNGHVVFWCPRDFPASFVAAWDVQILEDAGLTIVFFAARGEHGEDLFDPGLPKRDGTFSHYIHGAINSYHISYYASTPAFPGRATANLRKNNKFYLVASGPVAIAAGDKNAHRMRLVKDGPHVQFQADGRVVIDYTDPGTNRFGPVYGGGKIGLRQMQWTVARYRNFRVTELLPETGNGDAASFAGKLAASPFRPLWRNPDEATHRID